MKIQAPSKPFSINKIPMKMIIKLGEIRKLENNLFEAIEWYHALDDYDFRNKEVLGRKIDELQESYSKVCL